MPTKIVLACLWLQIEGNIEQIKSRFDAITLSLNRSRAFKASVSLLLIGVDLRDRNFTIIGILVIKILNLIMHCLNHHFLDAMIRIHRQ